MKRIIYTFVSLCLLLSVACQKDNFDEPSATLSGRVVYDGNPVGVRTNGTQLELWQDGYQLYTKIPVYIAHDGTFSASVFDGNYKLVRLAGAPWEDQRTDTIRIEVRGNTQVDVPVTPYFTINNESFTKVGDDIVAKFTIQKVVSTAEMARVRLFLGKSILTDQNRNEFSHNVDLSAITLGQETTVTATIPANLVNDSYVFARIGVRSSSSNEYLYTQVQKVMIK